MPAIAIRVDRAADTVGVVRLLRPLTGWGIARIKEALATESPVFEHELYLNDHAEVADTLRALVQGLQRLGVAFTIREDGRGIDSETLLNLLDGSERYRL